MYSSHARLVDKEKDVASAGGLAGGDSGRADIILNDSVAHGHGKESGQQ